MLELVSRPAMARSPVTCNQAFLDDYAQNTLTTSLRTRGTRHCSGIGTTCKPSARTATTAPSNGRNAPVNDQSERWNPERNMWREVLFLAVDEALYGPKHVNDRQHFIRMCQETRDYLTKPRRDLSMVCNLAGLDMQPVMERMRAQIGKAAAPEVLAVGRSKKRVGTV